jgi:uncharacterized protein YkwD
MTLKGWLAAILKALGGGKPTPVPPPLPPPAPPPPPALPPVPTPTPGDVPAELLAAHNARRLAANLPPLAPSAKLQSAASTHAVAMARTSQMLHEGLYDVDLADRLRVIGYRFRAAGENIAQGQRDVAQVMDSWLSSPGHRANILTPSFTEAGFAVSYDVRGEPYWCANFGTPAIAAPGAYASQPSYTSSIPEMTGDGEVAASSIVLAAD